MSSPPAFIFATCQVGAEQALKHELSQKWPAFRFAFSRPGFLTFKLPQGLALADDFNLRSVFARSYGFSLGQVLGESVEDCARRFWEVAASRRFEHLHVWQRDLFEAGRRGYQSGMTPAANDAALALSNFVPEAANAAKLSVNQVSQAGQTVLDCIVLEPNQWWAGYHQSSSAATRWPGGMFLVELPHDAVSRAYLKIEEALAWSRMPVRADDVWAEIGSAPGGSCQALLKRGLRVIGIDPADMDPSVLSNPNFQHWKKRGADVRRREYRQVRYLTADINVAPQYTLDTVESIVTHPEVKVRGLILTLKLLQWSLADEIPDYLARVRSWGYGQVRARQLHHNRMEVCIAAERKPGR